MFQLLLLAFIVVPVLEIAILVQIGSVLGTATTIGLVIISAIVGASLVRSQGLATSLSIRTRLAQGELPGRQIVEGALLLCSGVLLLTPGFVTDIFGMTVLLPPVRIRIAEEILKRLQLQVVSGAEAGFNPAGGFEPSQDPFTSSTSSPSSTPSRPQGGSTIDGEFERKE